MVKSDFMNLALPEVGKESKNEICQPPECGEEFRLLWENNKLSSELNKTVTTPLGEYCRTERK